jgi:ABC-type phosphate transport system substrate-binding protein
MTFVRQAMSVAAGLSWANMVNKAGKTVEPSVSTVQAAMSQFARNFSAGDLTIDIVDAPGDESWPLSYHTFLAFNRSVTALDCTNIQELTRFIAWALTNEEYALTTHTTHATPRTHALTPVLQSIHISDHKRRCADRCEPAQVHHRPLQ